jgi:hypothetical protein
MSSKKHLIAPSVLAADVAKLYDDIIERNPLPKLKVQ